MVYPDDWHFPHLGFPSSVTTCLLHDVAERLFAPSSRIPCTACVVTLHVGLRLSHGESVIWSVALWLINGNGSIVHILVETYVTVAPADLLARLRARRSVLR